MRTSSTRPQKEFRSGVFHSNYQKADPKLLSWPISNPSPLCGRGIISLRATASAQTLLTTFGLVQCPLLLPLLLTLHMRCELAYIRMLVSRSHLRKSMIWLSNVGGYIVLLALPSMVTESLSAQCLADWLARRLWTDARQRHLGSLEWPKFVARLFVRHRSRRYHQLLSGPRGVLVYDRLIRFLRHY